MESITKNLNEEENALMDSLPEIIFGPGGDIKTKRDKIDEFIHHLTHKTVESLSKTIIKEERENCISFESAVESGIIEISPSEFNGIYEKHDLEILYNIDSKIAVGNNKRGRGETLFSLGFKAYNNPEKGGDVYIRRNESKRVIEIKSTNNSGITPSLDNDPDIISPISEKIYEILNIFKNLYSEDLTPESIMEIENGIIQKRTTTESINLMDKGGEKFEELIYSLTEKIEIDKSYITESNKGRDFISILLLEQLNHYSKDASLFQTLAVFIEDKEKLPTHLVMLDSNEKLNFNTPKNIEILRSSDIVPKITKKKRMEIYTFNTK
jgi:hypothetical protein